MMDTTEKRILVVDDSPTMRMFISLSIKKVLKDSTVIEAVNGLDAFQKLQVHNFDLVLTDMVMPEMDGAQLIKRVRGILNKSIPIIIVTTKGEEVDRDLGLSLGADGYITKPVNYHDLREAVLKFFVGCGI